MVPLYGGRSCLLPGLGSSFRKGSRRPAIITEPRSLAQLLTNSARDNSRINLGGTESVVAAAVFPLSSHIPEQFDQVKSVQNLRYIMILTFSPVQKEALNTSGPRFSHLGHDTSIFVSSVYNDELIKLNYSVPLRCKCTRFSFTALLYFLMPIHPRPLLSRCGYYHQRRFSYTECTSYALSFIRSAHKQAAGLSQSLPEKVVGTLS